MMMRKQKLFGRRPVHMLALALAAPLGLAGHALADEAVLANAPPTPFVPFQLSDLKNPQTGFPLQPGEAVRIEVGGDVYFEGQAEDFLARINDLERKYCLLGVSLRQEGDVLHVAAQDASKLNAQFLNDLGIGDLIQSRVKEPIRGCKLLDIAHLGARPGTGRPFESGDRVEIERGMTLTARQFVARINNQEKVLCSLGYSIFHELGGPTGLTSVADPVQWLKRKRDEIITHLGISRLNPKFDWQTIDDVKSYEEIAAEVDRVLAARKTPSPEQLHELTKQSTAELGPEFQIPDFPDIPVPVAPRRMDLALTKRKDWAGINEGSRDTLNVYANAWYEIRGSEREEEAIAEGKAGFYVLGKEINALRGYASFYAGPAEVRAHAEFRALGHDIFPPLDIAGKVSHKESVPRLFSWSFDESSVSTFFIGPIPLSVTIGARANVFLGYEVALATTEVNASVLPGADAQGYIDAGVGFGGFLSAGAGGEVDLLHLSPTLAGNVGMRFDGEGVPFLRLGLNSDLVYSALNGRVYAYAEYPVPRFGLPPWKVKKSTLDIFSWPGFTGNYKIMNWGMDLSPFGVHLSGDLVDQTDREETRHLQQIIDIEQRKQALHNLEVDVIRKEREAFQAVMADLDGPSNRDASLQVATVGARRSDAYAARARYREQLLQFIQQ
ncbi:hypothetical protein [Sorangium sp. So ce1389]|uniref:hypothetical protein n=1 Tax=Sorangium sp. So ce1389 TaxID=3133336 RepID=UPI003F5DF627